MPKDTQGAAPLWGDKNKLSHDELQLLETKILPTARRWLNIAGLEEHAMKTLRYWGESFEIPVHLRSVEERERAGL